MHCTARFVGMHACVVSWTRGMSRFVWRRTRLGVDWRSWLRKCGIHRTAVGVNRNGDWFVSFSNWDWFGLFSIWVGSGSVIGIGFELKPAQDIRLVSFEPSIE